MLYYAQKRSIQNICGGPNALCAEVLYLLLLFGFALVERKTEQQINREYPAAAGSKAFVRSTISILRYEK